MQTLQPSVLGRARLSSKPYKSVVVAINLGRTVHRAPRSTVQSVAGNHAAWTVHDASRSPGVFQEQNAKPSLQRSAWTSFVDGAKKFATAVGFAVALWLTSMARVQPATAAAKKTPAPATTTTKAAAAPAAAAPVAVAPAALDWDVQLWNAIPPAGQEQILKLKEALPEDVCKNVVQYRKEILISISALIIAIPVIKIFSSAAAQSSAPSTSTTTISAPPPPPASEDHTATATPAPTIPAIPTPPPVTPVPAATAAAAVTVKPDAAAAAAAAPLPNSNGAVKTPPTPPKSPQEDESAMELVSAASQATLQDSRPQPVPGWASALQANPIPIASSNSWSNSSTPMTPRRDPSPQKRMPEPLQPAARFTEAREDVTAAAVAVTNTAAVATANIVEAAAAPVKTALGNTVPTAAATPAQSVVLTPPVITPSRTPQASALGASVATFTSGRVNTSRDPGVVLAGAVVAAAEAAAPLGKFVVKEAGPTLFKVFNALTSSGSSTSSEATGPVSASSSEAKSP